MPLTKLRFVLMVCLALPPTLIAQKVAPASSGLDDFDAYVGSVTNDAYGYQSSAPRTTGTSKVIITP
ncbi:MAG: hypothetical protein M3O09_18055 [Acidobacteriota bacterium]|nr:hypothetical protein [Acidobacteriota bacterium]